MEYMLCRSQEGKQLRIFLRALLQKIALHLLNWLRGASLEFSVSPLAFFSTGGSGSSMGKANSLKHLDPTGSPKLPNEASSFLRSTDI